MFYCVKLNSRILRKYIPKYLNFKNIKWFESEEIFIMLIKIKILQLLISMNIVQTIPTIANWLLKFQKMYLA